MIDIHTHILPAIDDGSPDLKTSIKQIKMMVERGVTNIVCTPHFMRNNYHNTDQIITSKFQLLKKEIAREKIDVKLHKAAEVYLDNKSLQTIKKEQFNIDNTKFVLVETSMSEFPADLYDILFHLVLEGYKPILAHPERYQPFQKNCEIAEEFMYKNVYLQMNAGSFLGQYGTRIQKTAWNMLSKGYVHFIASDNHCRHEDYSLALAYDAIAETIDNYTAKLLIETNPKKLLNDEKIDFFYVEASNTENKTFLEKIKEKIKKLL